MTGHEPRNILVQVDAESPSPEVLDCGVDLAKKGHGRLKIVDVIPDNPWPVRLLTAGIERAIEEITHGKSSQLAAIAEELAKQGVKVTTKLLDAPSSAAIIREVVRAGHDLVIRETKGRHSRRMGFFGTTATRLLRKCPCPVLLLNPGHALQLPHAVVAVDAASDDEVHAALNSTILETAKTLCPSARQLSVVCAWQLHGEAVLKDQMREDDFELLKRQAKGASQRRLDDLVARSGVGVSSGNVHLLHGEAARIIPKFVADHAADLVIMGTIGRSGLQGLMIGNTAEQILNQLECAVLTVKPEEFKTPIQV